ncbi:MAG: fructose-6-phosphate aldolase [Planctomycetota bacterium]|nr:fructose-6-phosphate aldolase [Planctomycetota bacterium]
MQIFLDTAEVDDIRTYAAWGVIDGVTTNPSLIAKSGRVFEEVIAEICEIVDGPISAEVTALDAEGMVAQAEPLAAIHPNVTIKVPLIPEGLKATKVLSGRGIKTNVTLCFSLNQAVLAAKAGATFVSPFIGRLDDRGERGMELIEEIVHAYEQYPEFHTQVLVASVRNADHVRQAALAGADIATIPPKIMDKMVKHDLTDSGLAAFLADWESAKTAEGVAL